VVQRLQLAINPSQLWVVASDNLSGRDADNIHAADPLEQAYQCLVLYLPLSIFASQVQLIADLISSVAVTGSRGHNGCAIHKNGVIVHRVKTKGCTNYFGPPPPGVQDWWLRYPCRYVARQQ
jgi:hypothetical protein